MPKKKTAKKTAKKKPATRKAASRTKRPKKAAIPKAVVKKPEPVAPQLLSGRGGDDDERVHEGATPDPGGLLSEGPRRKREW